MLHKTARDLTSQPDNAIAARAARACQRCGGPLHGRTARARVCIPCFRANEREYSRRYAKARPVAIKAHMAVANAVYRGDLPSLRLGDVMCVDCGEYRAQCYDHRDYTKPLEVEPVCGGCNKRRGPGYPYNQ